MKTAFTIFIVSLLLSACSVRPQKPSFRKSKGASSENASSQPGTSAPPAQQHPQFVDSNDPLDAYLSIGPYLQKEFDAAENAGKTVKVYLQVRQENSIPTNFKDLRTTLGPLHASVIPALESAEKKGLSTVEFEAEVGALKGAVGAINKAVSGMEVSLPAVK